MFVCFYRIPILERNWEKSSHTRWPTGNAWVLINHQKRVTLSGTVLQEITVSSCGVPIVYIFALIYFYYLLLSFLKKRSLTLFKFFYIVKPNRNALQYDLNK